MLICADKMHAAHSKAIDDNLVALTKDLTDIDGVVCWLAAERILMPSMCEEILAAGTSMGKASLLLDIIPKRGPNAFSKFVAALLETGQSHLAVLLDENEVTEWQIKKLVKHAGQIDPVPFADGCSGSGATLESTTKAFNQHPMEYFEKKLTAIDWRDPTVKELLKSQGKDVYTMCQKKRGRCVIINNKIFTQQSMRWGTEKDADSLRLLFGALCYDVDVWDNYSFDELLCALEIEALREDHKAANAFFMFILSHGTEGHFFLVSNEKVKIESFIVKLFDGKHCRGLIGKPKIFMIQACQGSSSSASVLPDAVEADEAEHDGAERDGVEPDATELLRDAIDEQDSKCRKLLQKLAATMPSDQAGHERPETRKTHENADALVAYATVHNEVAYRLVCHGSWFVQHFVDSVYAHAHEYHLNDILTDTRQRFQRHQVGGSFVQLPPARDRLLRKFYFFPGYPN